jgi:hypothetical protein
MKSLLIWLKKKKERKIGVMVDGYIVVVRRSKYVIVKSEKHSFATMRNGTQKCRHAHQHSTPVDDMRQKKKSKRT